jgi:hypothetical protein
MLLQMFGGSGMGTARGLVRSAGVPAASISQKGFVSDAAPSSFTQEAAAWSILAILLTLCLWRGVISIQGVAYPPDEDLIRDVGFIQTILNGNLFGDPIFPGEARWYPPLLSMVGAAGAWVSGQPAAIFALQAGPWLGLLPVLAVFLLARQMFGPAAAVITTALFALVNPTISRPWMVGGYSPWPYASSFGIALFCFGLCVILRSKLLRWRDAVVVGGLCGAALLAHPMPALILSACAAAAAVSIAGLRTLTIVWLAIIAAVEIAVSMVLFLPLILQYGMHIQNTGPGSWIDWSLALQFLPWTLRLVLPGALAMAAIWALSRGGISSQVTAVLAAWMIPCAAMLARHYACSITGLVGGVCAPSSIPPNHALLYLILAGTVLLGFAASLVVAAWLQEGHGQSRSRLRLASVALLLAFGLEVWQVQRANAYDQTFDPVAKLRASGEKMDLDLYLWLARDPLPGAVFVTDTGNAAAWTVYAAARPLLGAAATHSNPYVDLAPREALRQRALASLTQPERACGDPDGVTYYAMMTNLGRRGMEHAVPVYRTGQHVVLRIRGLCMD